MDTLFKSSAREILVGLTIISVTLIMLLLLIEFGGRYYAKYTHQPRGMTFDSELGWKAIPNVKKIGPLWGQQIPASTNTLGWRDTEHSLNKPEGTTRAIAVGDSFTWGVGVDDGERFTDLLNQNNKQLEVINLGMPAYGTDQEFRVLQLYGFDYQPDIVILTVFLGNDLEDIRKDLIYSWPKPYFTMNFEGLRLWKPILSWGVRVRTMSYLVEFLFRKVQKFDSEYRIVPAYHMVPAWEKTDTLPLFEVLVRAIIEKTQQYGARVLIVAAYQSKDLNSVPPDQVRALEALKQMGVTVLDTRPEFLEKIRRGDKLYVKDTVHWNSVGHSIVARKILPYLK